MPAETGEGPNILGKALDAAAHDVATLRSTYIETMHAIFDEEVATRSDEEGRALLRDRDLLRGWLDTALRLHDLLSAYDAEQDAPEDDPELREALEDDIGIAAVEYTLCVRALSATDEEEDLAVMRGRIAHIAEARARLESALRLEELLVEGL